MEKFKYDLELLIEGQDLNYIDIKRYIENNFKGADLLIIGTKEVVRIRYNTNMPWKVMEFCATQGEIYGVMIVNLVRQARGLEG